MSAGGGRLVLVATPIGNLGDLSPRAAATLSAADLVACEDTRHTGRLLELAGLRARRLVAVHAHNEAARAVEIVEACLGGQVVALVSDAGTPALSDPGGRVVAAAVAAGVEVSAVPGPSAALCALVVSGLPTERFRFDGFLPRKGAERRARLGGIASAAETSICYESPHRVGDTLADLAEACGPGRAVVVARELTKLHEEIWRGSLAEASARWAATETRGEHVIVVAPAPGPEAGGAAELGEAVRRLRDAGFGAREVQRVLQALLGASRADAYAAAHASAPG